MSAWDESSFPSTSDLLWVSSSVRWCWTRPYCTGSWPGQIRQDDFHPGFRAARKLPPVLWCFPALKVPLLTEFSTDNLNGAENWHTWLLSQSRIFYLRKSWAQFINLLISFIYLIPVRYKLIHRPAQTLRPYNEFGEARRNDGRRGAVLDRREVRIQPSPIQSIKFSKINNLLL